ncbi:MAG: hypothetical protein IKZ43_09480 [Acidaminococcaceae bacterium]|nr:hypothetical protein [Acidaminococcaceae bacterium]
MSCLITQTCNGYTVTLQVEILSVRPVSETADKNPAAASPAPGHVPEAIPDTPANYPGEKGGEKESEKKVTQRKEKEKDPERESLASQLSRIAEAWNRLPLKKIARFTGKRKERTEMLLAQYPVEEIVSTIYSIARSRFLLGGGANHWQIRFDWLILPENFEKVRNGNYLDEEEDTDRQQSRPGLGYCSRDLQDINQVWTDSSDSLAGGNA